MDLRAVCLVRAMFLTIPHRYYGILMISMRYSLLDWYVRVGNDTSEMLVLPIMHFALLKNWKMRRRAAFLRFRSAPNSCILIKNSTESDGRACERDDVVSAGLPRETEKKQIGASTHYCRYIIERSESYVFESAWYLFLISRHR